jgi:hypothetical protein
MRQRIEGMAAVAAGGKEAMTIVEAGEALVEAREFAGKIADPFLLEGVGIGGEIEGPAEPCDRLGGVAGAPVRVRKQRRRLVLHDVADDLAAILIGVHGMENIAGIALEPAYRRDLGVPPHHADIGALVCLPRIGRLA